MFPYVVIIGRSVFNHVTIVWCYVHVTGQVQGVRVRIVGETSVNVTWEPLDSLDVSNYQVYYTMGSKKRKGDR